MENKKRQGKGVRLFVAVALSEPVKEGLLDMQKQLKRQGFDGNFTPQENMHLTVAFIGEYPDPEKVIEALSHVTFRSFPLELEGIGQFGDLWWCGIGKNKPLEDVVKQVRHILAEDEIPFDRKKFRGHITLLRNAVDTQGKGSQGIDVPSCLMSVEELTLMCSDRGKRGMTYTPVYVIPAE